MSSGTDTKQRGTGVHWRLRRFFRVSLRGALFLVTLLCALLAWIARDVHQPYYRSRLIAVVEGAGGKVQQDEIPWDEDYRAPGRSFAYWIQAFWNERLTLPISEVNLSKSRVTDDEMQTIAALVRALPEIESVILTQTTVGDRSVAALAKGRLTKLNLSQTRVTPAAAESLARMQHLKMLWLDGTKVGDETLVALADLPKLALLSLDDTRVSNAGLELLGACKLRWLSLSRTQVTDRGVLALERRNHYLHVYVEGINLRPLSEVAKLTTVQLVGSFFDDSSLERLNDAPRVTYLKLNCPRITAAGLARVKQKGQIVSLDLDWSGADDRHLAALEGWDNLQMLRVNETNITDAGLAHLARLPRLATLHLEKTAVTDSGLIHLGRLEQLEWLSLSDTGIDGSGLHHLRGLSKLRHLGLDGTAITDESLRNLPPLPQLNYIDLDRTAVTLEGIRHLQRPPKLRTISYGQ